MKKIKTKSGVEVKEIKFPKGRFTTKRGTQILKKLIGKNCITLLLALFTLSLQAQEIVLDNAVKKESFFQMNEDHLTEESVQIEGKSFSIYQTPSGSQYLKSVSKDGGEYPVWIGKPSSYTSNGNPVRITKTKKAVILYLKANGYPHVKYLTFKEINGKR